MSTFATIKCPKCGGAADIVAPLHYYGDRGENVLAVCQSAECSQKTFAEGDPQNHYGACMEIPLAGATVTFPLLDGREWNERPAGE